MYYCGKKRKMKEYVTPSYSKHSSLKGKLNNSGKSAAEQHQWPWTLCHCHNCESLQWNSTSTSQVGSSKNENPSHYMFWKTGNSTIPRAREALFPKKLWPPLPSEFIALASFQRARRERWLSGTIKTVTMFHYQFLEEKQNLFAVNVFEKNYLVTLFFFFV